MNERIYLSSPHMGGTEQQYVQEAFDTNWIAPLGNNVNEFEKQIKEFTGTNAACALSSGTAGIHIALDLLGVGKGDSVFCSSLTFVASANPITYLGATPVFIDSNLESWNMCPKALKHAFETHHQKPKAVVVVNLYGQSAQYDQIKGICDAYQVPIVEDAAESLGAKYHDKMSGTYGDFGVFSFNGNKIITTSGGGMLISDDASKIEHALKKATQAREKAIHYEHTEVGYNYRLSNISAGIGRGQMEVLDVVKQKREIFQRYVEGLKDIDAIEFMPELPSSYHNRWLSTLLLNPDKTNVTVHQIIDALATENIEARPVWKPMHMQPVYEGNEYYCSGDEDVSRYLFEQGICLPSDTKMDEELQNIVIKIIRQVFGISRL